MKTETYYDIQCSSCGRYISSDFDRGMGTTKKGIVAIAKSDGWKYDRDTNANICPICVKAGQNNVTFL